LNEERTNIFASFSLSALREARQRKGLTLKQVAQKMGVSPPQVQRIESGERRLTVDFLERFCDAVELNLLDLFHQEVFVPIIGVIDINVNIQPLPAGMNTMVRAPRIVSHPERLAGVRWHAGQHYKVMEGHVAFFYADTKGIPHDAWGRRCIMRRTDGTQRYGWLFQEDGQIHIIDPGHEPELNVKLEWASPVLGVIAPQLLE